MRLALLVLAGALAMSAGGAQAAGGDARGSRQERDLALAREIATRAATEAEADVSSASFVVRDGTVAESNVGHQCTSGRLIEVKLIGAFPHIVTTGHPVLPGEDFDDDFTVTAMVLTADAADGAVCLQGVQTGAVEPEPGAMAIPMG